LLLSSHLQSWIYKSCSSDFHFAGILLRVAARYSLTILQVRTYSRCSKYSVLFFAVSHCTFKWATFVRKPDRISIIAITKNPCTSTRLDNEVCYFCTISERTNFFYKSKNLITVWKYLSNLLPIYSYFLSKWDQL